MQDVDHARRVQGHDVDADVGSAEEPDDENLVDLPCDHVENVDAVRGKPYDANRAIAGRGSKKRSAKCVRSRQAIQNATATGAPVYAREPVKGVIWCERASAP